MFTSGSPAISPFRLTATDKCTKRGEQKQRGREKNTGEEEKKKTNLISY
jgi:hypothetical protein